MTIVKYKTSIGTAIERIEVLRETENSVYLPPFSYQARDGKTERRESKISDFVQYHDTWAAAHAYLVSKADFKVSMAAAALKSAQRDLSSAQSLKPPKEAS